ncbi:unnamed protein product, partial [Choristocarpus tenellus]
LKHSPRTIPPSCSSNLPPPLHLFVGHVRWGAMAETTCPVFRPTEREFKNFREYLSKIDPIAGPVGLCKIIPP